MRKGQNRRRRGDVLRGLLLLVAAGALWAGAPAAAYAAEAGAKAHSAPKVLDPLASAFTSGADMNAVERIEDGEMSKLRGGFRQTVAFGILMYTDVSQLDVSGVTDDVEITSAGDGIQLVMNVGDLGGASGIFQFTNINGDNVTVNQSVVVNIITVNDATAGPGELLETYFPVFGGS